jgi:hypothetical protein
VTHWEVVGRGDERAIALISFSCIEADALRLIAPKHVRANLFVSMYLLRPVSNGEQAQCHVTRLLSFDLGGGMNQHLSNVISAQQANLPAVLAEYFQRHEPVVANRYMGLPTNETVVAAIIKRLNRSSNGAPSSPLRPPSPLNSDDSDAFVALGNEPKGGRRLPSVESQAVVLFAPVIVHWLVNQCRIPGSALVFSLGAFLAVRQVVLWHLGDVLLPSEEPAVLGPVTCRYTVDLKGVLRFIANKKEERVELQSGSADVSVIHIAASALARAMQKEPSLHSRRVVIPWLFIDKIVDASAEPVDVSVSENGGGVVTLKSVQNQNIQCIADTLATAEYQTSKTQEMGQCLVLAMSNYDGFEMVTEAAPVHRDVAVVAVLGGVHLEHPAQSSPRAANGANRAASPRPVLSLSLTITGHQQPDIVTCRRFADEVRKLLIYPEICESG